MAKATKRNQSATNKQPPVAGSRYDWTALRTRFVTGSESISEFAEREGINRTTVAKRVSAEGWTAEREKHRERVAGKAQADLANRQAASESEIDSRAHKLALKLFDSFEALIPAVADPQEAKALAQGLAETHRLARVTAHLTPEPLPAPASADADGVIRIRRRSPDGAEVEVVVDGSTSHRSGPEGLSGDTDAMGVPAGSQEPGEGSDRRIG